MDNKDSTKQDNFWKAVIVIGVLIYTLYCIVSGMSGGGSGTSSSGRKCKVCGKKYDFNWSDVCDSCQSWHQGLEDAFDSYGD